MMEEKEQAREKIMFLPFLPFSSPQVERDFLYFSYAASVSMLFSSSASSSSSSSPQTTAWLSAGLYNNVSACKERTTETERRRKKRKTKKPPATRDRGDNNEAIRGFLSSSSSSSSLVDVLILFILFAVFFCSSSVYPNNNESIYSFLRFHRERQTNHRIVCLRQNVCLSAHVSCYRHTRIQLSTYVNKRFHDVIFSWQIPAEEKITIHAHIIITTTTREERGRKRGRAREGRRKRKKTDGMSKASYKRRMIWQKKSIFIPIQRNGVGKFLVSFVVSFSLSLSSFFVFFDYSTFVSFENEKRKCSSNN